MSKLMALLGRFLFETNDAMRLRKQRYDTSDLEIFSDIPYMEDGDEGHLFDVYRPKGAPADVPVIVNIHGGGLFASYKAVNTWFNHEWARMGYAVVSLSYRRIPDTTLIHQIEDVMTALRFLRENRGRYGLNLDKCYLTGDSAGALLALFVLSLEGSEALRSAFGIASSGIRFRAAGLISIMLDTTRRDLMFFMRNVVSDEADEGKPYRKYLLDPVSMLKESALPPLYLVTSAQDLIRKDTLKFDRALSEAKLPHQLLDFPKGDKEKLVHVFSVQYPLWPESRIVYQEIDNYFKIYFSDIQTGIHPPLA